MIIDALPPGPAARLADASQGHHPGAAREPGAAQHAADVGGEGRQAVVVPGLGTTIFRLFYGIYGGFMVVLWWFYGGFMRFDGIYPLVIEYGCGKSTILTGPWLPVRKL